MFLEQDLFHSRTVCYGCTKTFKWLLFYNRMTFDFVVYLFEEQVRNSGKFANSAGLIPYSSSLSDETFNYIYIVS